MPRQAGNVVYQVEARVGRAEAAIRRLSGQFSGLDRTMRRSVAASRQAGFGLDRYARSARRAALSVGALVSAGAALRLASATREALEFNGALLEQARVVGLSVEELQGLRRVFAGDGIGTDAAQRALERFVRAVGDARRGVGETGKVFAALNLDPAALGGNLIEQLDAVGNALARIPDDARRAALAQRLFEDQGARLVPILTAQAGGLADAAREFTRFGAVTAEQAEASKRAAQALADLQAAVDLRRVAAGSADAVEDLAQSLTVILPPVVDAATRSAAALGRAWEGTGIRIQAATELVRNLGSTGGYSAILERLQGQQEFERQLNRASASVASSPGTGIVGTIGEDAADSVSELERLQAEIREILSLSEFESGLLTGLFSDVQIENEKIIRAYRLRLEAAGAETDEIERQLALLRQAQALQGDAQRQRSLRAFVSIGGFDGVIGSAARRAADAAAAPARHFASAWQHAASAATDDFLRFTARVGAAADSLEDRLIQLALTLAQTFAGAYLSRPAPSAPLPAASTPAAGAGAAASAPTVINQTFQLTINTSDSAAVRHAIEQARPALALDARRAVEQGLTQAGPLRTAAKIAVRS